MLTAAQNQAFFENNDQRGIPHATVVHLVNEGIATVTDLADFNKTSLKQFADKLHHPGGHVLDPIIGQQGGAPPGATIPTPPFIFYAKSQKCLAMACDLIHYYETTGCDLTAANSRWTHVVKNFEIQWISLKAHKEEDELDVPKITCNLLLISWMESFLDFLAHVIRV